MLQMPDSDFDSILEILERRKKQNDEYYFEIEVKKAAGTYEAWLKEIEEENLKFSIDKFFEAWRKSVPPIKTPNRLN